jgi:orotate phosphoribosyltransferase
MTIENHTDSRSLEASIAAQLLEIQAVKLSPEEPFTWASGMLSPIYCDNRIALSYPKVRRAIIDGLVQKSAGFQEFDVVAGVATAGIPHGALLADRLDTPFVYVRSSAKDHGRRNLIEGSIPQGARVLVIEDLISTGGSCIKAVETLQEAGCIVVGVLAIFQYGFPKAAAAFEAIQIPYQTLTNYEVLVEQAASTGYIKADQMATLQKWRDNPEAWGALYV